MNFRRLNADEIDCRVSTVSEKGLSLLLYKDARVDMRILDETVGAENWQRKHELINGNLFCNVGIKCGAEWVWKQDVGTESNTEKEKGQASDSFKRACFNWGIGRELYSAPFIWIPAKDCTIKDGRNGKPTCYDRFTVMDIGYSESGNINRLSIVNDSTGAEVYTFPRKTGKKEEGNANGYPPVAEMVKTCEGYYKGENLNRLLEFYKVKAISELNYGQLCVAWAQSMKGRQK